MNRLKTLMTLAILLLMVACNKSEDIISPDGHPYPVIDLEYTVLEYTPAPGQFINDPNLGFKDVSSPAAACKIAEERFSQGLYVSLGGWGGYMVIRFNESVKNRYGYDFSIGSNAFDTSNEPGIVWVMKDENSNGLPDDEWYELKGSHFGESGYERNYWVTYYRPGAKSNTPWSDSNGEEGEIPWMGNYHSQDFYYPNWIKADSYTLYGSRLPNQAYMNPDTGSWINLPFLWGYADNDGEDFQQQSFTNVFDISNAITSSNNPADLDQIDFVRVQTAVNGTSGWLGENSTEVSGFFIIN